MLNVLSSNELPQTLPLAAKDSLISTAQACFNEENSRRRLLLLGVGTLTTSLIQANPLLAEEVLKNYRAFVDSRDGYSYNYPSDWINVRVRFIPTNKKDIHELGPMEQVISDLVKHVYAVPNQRPTIIDIQEKSVDGKNYYTFEYELTSPNYSSTYFCDHRNWKREIYTLIVGANERRWKRFRDRLKVVADSFKILDI